MNRVIIVSPRTLQKTKSFSFTRTFASIEKSDTFASVEKKNEDFYFHLIDEGLVKQLGVKMYQKELSGLLRNLPTNHGLKENDLHRLLEWKHLGNQ